MIMKRLLFALLTVFAVACTSGNGVKVTELKGEKVMTLDYKPSLPSMMVVDDLLIVANGRSNDKVMIYDKETLALKSKITLAERPDYDRALLFPIEGDEYICGYFFPFFGDVYGLKKNLTSEQLKVGKYYADVSSISFGMVSVAGANKDGVIFCGKDKPNDRSAKGYCIWNYGAEKTDMLFDMTDGMNSGAFASSAGIMSMNEEVLVFGYKYHDWISFIDRKTGEVKTVKRDSPGFSIANEADYSDKNPQYFNASLNVGEKVWIHNMEGYIPLDPNSHLAPYTRMECYSTKGELLEVFHLDHYGAFAVDEAVGKVYLISYDEEAGVYVYDIKE
jgi:hypothetical protein